MDTMQEVRVGSVEIDATTAAAVADYSRLGLEIKALEDKRKAASAAILAALHGAPQGTYNGVLRVAVTMVSREVIDAKVLKAAFPEAYAASRNTTTYPRISPK